MKPCGRLLLLVVQLAHRLRDKGKHTVCCCMLSSCARHVLVSAVSVTGAASCKGVIGIQTLQRVYVYTCMCLLENALLENILIRALYIATMPALTRCNLSGCCK